MLLLRVLLYIAKELKHMSKELDRLTSSVAHLTEVSESAETLLGGLAEALRDAAEDPEAVNKLADDIDANTAKLAEAVTANTPAAPAPEPTE